MTPLSERDLAALVRTQQVVLAPLDHPTPGLWVHAVAEALRTLFVAERAVVTLGNGSDTVLVALGVDEGALPEYEVDFAESDAAGEIVTARGVPYYVEEDFAGDPLFSAHTSTAVYNEWYRAHGLTEAMGMFVLGTHRHVPGLYARVEAPIVSNVLLAGSPLSTGPEAGRARTMLALLQPALAASVQTWQRAGHVAIEVATAIDGLGTAAWLYDEAGRLLHESAGATRSASAPSERAALRASAGELAAAMLRGGRRRTPVSPTRTVTVGGRPARLVGTSLRPEGPWAPAVLVHLVSSGGGLPSAEVVQERFALTRQQARVALLLAARRSTAEIAEALSISPHTVRRHTEQVLARLGVARRGGIEDALSSSPTSGAT